MLIFDLDGVIRNLCQACFGRHIDTWDQKIDGKDLVDVINDDLGILMSAPPTEYFEVIKQVSNLFILSCQPAHWRRLTNTWIHMHFFHASVRVEYVNSIPEKLSIVASHNAILVEDYPKFSDYSKVILIDRPYNRHVTGFIDRVTTPAQLERHIQNDVAVGESEEAAEKLRWKLGGAL